MKIITCTLLLAISISAFAQQEKDHKKHEGRRMMGKLPYMTRSLGGSFQAFDALNARVANLPQYKQLKDFAPTIGLGWLNDYKNVITNANLTLGSTMSGHRDEKSSTYRYIGVSADIGYDVVKSDRIMLYPMVGLGYQKYQALFYRDNTSVDFNTVLGSPDLENSISAVKFKNGYGVYRLGIGFSVKAPTYPAAIGIQAGYVGSFKKNQWRTNEDQTLANAPEERISQFYISLVLMSKPWMMMKKM